MAEAYRKKLIEVALPLEAINRGAAHEKRSTFLRGHPRSIHHWWARRPLAACRAVLFASLVDDPSSRPDLFPTEEEQEVERQRLFRIIEELVKWENTTNETVLDAAREEIRKATDGNPPPVLDPFCGGGSIPLEAQRLGLEAHASDLNPVAVLITKALIEIPPKFAGKPPVNPEAREKLAHGATWKGAQGLAEDVRYYGKWMRDRAVERIGHLYPKAKLPDGGETPVIAWLWARTVTCPNPACGAEIPLVRSFALSTKKGREWHVEPEIDGGVVRFEVRPGRTSREGTAGRGGVRCVVCATVTPLAHIRAAGRADLVGRRLLAIVAEAARGRVYLPPSDDQEAIALSVVADDGPETMLPSQALGFRVQAYGLTRHRDLFTPRQLVALGTLCELVQEVRSEVLNDGGASAYADAVATYMGLALGKLVPYLSSLTTWHNSGEQLQSVFARQSLSMVWDYAESSPLGKSLGLGRATQAIAEILRDLPTARTGDTKQLDAAAALPASEGMVVTDPPYYDNIGYADLADVFYIWLKRALQGIYPQLFATVLSPKREELIADPHRFSGGAAEAKAYFEAGLRAAFTLAGKVHESRSQPLVFYYAFKQAEEDHSGQRGAHVSTGWETMLEGLMKSGFSITATWPMRTEGETRSRNRGGFNALASSVVLVCRPRGVDASLATRRDFIKTLRTELPQSLRDLQSGSIAPVDLAQAAIGPGMAVFSRYAKVLEADGTSMTVRSALALINQTLDEILAEQEGDFDADTRFAVTWFDQRGFEEGPFGEADVLARAKDTSTRGLEDAGILLSRAGKVRLLRRDELPDDWDPITDRRPTVWEATQHLARRLESDGGEMAAAELLRRLGGLGETARELAYRLYTTCERKGWAQDALAYNALVVAWPEIARLVAGTPEAEAQQSMPV